MIRFKKNATYFFSCGLAALLLTASVSSCTKDNTVLYPADTAANYLENLRNYKKSDHQIMAGYFRTWRDKATDPATNKTSMKELPDSLDIAFVFPDYTPETNAFGIR
ncbi:glycoside hydrolase family 18 [Sphingobacterium sp. E70]|uniref:glycoside hydrolase family 18 n=1 Tax=Sphingobacterium sp. E70 TaxID=2853439 RepID=UPI00211D02D1|nr:glycoside hydrolase family 18 [Sphingobacterium sp. E70]ULT25261.1 glycoside hydrolase family 18 [Sphingobacterium sp. E70]